MIEDYGHGAVHYPVNQTILRSKVAVFAEPHRKHHENTLANRTLHAEITDRKQAQEALRQAHDMLEQRVVERTAELPQVHHILQGTTTHLRPILAQSSVAISNWYRDVRLERAGGAGAGTPLPVSGGEGKIE